MRFRRQLSALPIAAIVLLAACGTDEATPSNESSTTTTTELESADEEALQRISDAAEATTEAGTARMMMTIGSEGTGTGADEAQLEASGEVDFAEERRRVTFQGPEGELEAIIDGTDVYLELPATEDETWVQVELAQLVEGDVGFGGPGGLPFQDPADTFMLLRTAASDVRDAGSESIDGEDTDHFRVTIDLETAAASSDADDDLRRRLREGVAATGVETLDMHVWLDSDDRIRRIRYAVDLGEVAVDEGDTEGQVEADPEGQLFATIEYRDFGTDVTIEVPGDDAQIIEMDEDELRSTFAGGSSSGSGSSSGGSSSRSSTTSSTTSTTRR